MRRVLYFFPHNPIPPRSGAHKRCLEVLAGLRELGCEVIFTSSTLSSESKWQTSSIDELKSLGVAQVRVHRAWSIDGRLSRTMLRVYRRLGIAVPINSMIYSPPIMRLWFWKLYREVGADLIMMNYAYWDGLIRRRMRGAVRTVIDSYDLSTLHEAMSRRVNQLLPRFPIDPAQTDDRLVDEDFFARHEASAAASEYRVFDKYDLTIAISGAEATLIQQNTSRTTVLTLPMTYRIPACRNDYSGAAIFPTGPTRLNLQGYLYFAKRVLPRVLERCPDFLLQVTGTVCKQVVAQSGVGLMGFVPDLSRLYESARFLICPLLGKTGQQIKIVEAMAHGLPAIATRQAAEGSPIRHGQNGVVAGSAAELAEWVVRLWNDRALCRKMGEAARDTIAAECSRERLVESLRAILID